MQSAAEYIAKTESAMRKFFDGIDSYLEVLRRSPNPFFVTSNTEAADFYAQHEEWTKDNQHSIAASLEAQEKYAAELFAQATLCGAVLQVAAKALECYSKNTDIPSEWSPVIKPKQKPVRFCVGRLIHGVPLGLVIYAARNQHTHFGDAKLNEPNLTVFERLATNHGIQSSQPFRHPAFDLQNPGLVSFASNCTALIGWRSYEAYEKDLRVLLGI